MLERFEEEIGQAIDLRWSGYLFLLDNPRDPATFRANAAMQNRLGAPSRILSAEGVRAMAPLLRLDDIIAAAWRHKDGLADPNGVVQGYAAAARRGARRSSLGPRSPASASSRAAWPRSRRPRAPSPPALW